MLDPTLAPFHIAKIRPLDPDPAPPYSNNLHLRSHQKLSSRTLHNLVTSCHELRDWMLWDYGGELVSLRAKCWLYDEEEVWRWRPAAMEGMSKEKRRGE